MSAYGRVFAALYDRTLRGSEDAGLRALRARLLAQARGRTVELGAGTGANLSCYPGAVDVIFTEPDRDMGRKLRANAPHATVLQAPADALPFLDHSVDTLVSTLVLCTVPSVDAVLAEARRVLKPGGRLLFLEHVRHPDPARARRQDRWNPVQRAVARGCNLNRSTPDLMAAAGWTVSGLERHPFPKAPSVLQPLVLASATP